MLGEEYRESFFMWLHVIFAAPFTAPYAAREKGELPANIYNRTIGDIMACLQGLFIYPIMGIPGGWEGGFHCVKVTQPAV